MRALKLLLTISLCSLQLQAQSLYKKDYKYTPAKRYFPSSNLPKLTRHNKNEIRVMIIDTGVNSSYFLNKYVSNWSISNDVDSKIGRAHV